MRILLLALVINLVYSKIDSNNITIEKKKLIILSSKDHGDISLKINQIISSSASQLKRYNVIDRNQIDLILKEQKFQHSGAVDQKEAVELGQISGANEALLVNIINFGQYGVPTEQDKENEKEDVSETGLVDWIIKEAVKAKIDKDLKDVERYPNNIQTIIDGEIHQDYNARIIRDGAIIFNGKSGSIVREKNQAKQVSAGLECGITIKDFNDYQEKDIIEVYNSTVTERRI